MKLFGIISLVLIVGGFLGFELAKDGRYFLISFCGMVFGYFLGLVLIWRGFSGKKWLENPSSQEKFPPEFEVRYRDRILPVFLIALILLVTNAYLFWVAIGPIVGEISGLISLIYVGAGFVFVLSLLLIHRKL